VLGNVLRRLALVIHMAHQYGVEPRFYLHDCSFVGWERILSEVNPTQRCVK